MSFRHYSVLILLFVLSRTTTVNLSGMYLSIVSLQKRYMYIYTFIVSQNVSIYKICLTRYVFGILDTYLHFGYSRVSRHGCDKR